MIKNIIFDLLLNRYQLKAEKCLFIYDDDAERSYNVANKIGIKGIKVKADDIEDIYKLLEEYNINLK